MGTEQQPHVRRLKELSNSSRTIVLTAAGISIGTTIGAAVSTMVGGASVGRFVEAREGPGVDCATSAVVK